MKSKEECLKILQDKGADAVLDEHNIMMVKPNDKVSETQLRKYMKNYPYSWGIKGNIDAEEEADE